MCKIYCTVLVCKENKSISFLMMIITIDQLRHRFIKFKFLIFELIFQNYLERFSIVENSSGI